MGKESIFLSCLAVLIIFEVGYYFMNPLSAWMLGVGAITSIVVVGVTTGLLAGLNVAASGENSFGARLGFISSTLFCLLFQFDIPTSTVNGQGSTIFFGSLIAQFPNTTSAYTYGGTSTIPIPIGIGLFYPNMTNIFITSNTDSVSVIGMMIVSILVLVTVITGLMIAAGDHG